MPTSAPGSSGFASLPWQEQGCSLAASLPSLRGGRGRPRGAAVLDRASRVKARGFTLIELMVVVAMIAIATAVASLALRDPAAAKLEQEAVRLASLLESARAEARASGVAARWEPLAEPRPTAEAFRFVGLPPTDPLPTRWLDAEHDARR